MWNTLREIRKFTPKAEVDRILGASPMQIENRPAWYFPDADTLKLELGLTCFDAEDAAPLEEDIVDGVITYQSTFQEIRRCAARHSLEYYSEGETQRLAEGSMAFLRRWIAWEEYEFYFYGKSRRTKMTGFHFVQPE